MIRLTIFVFTVWACGMIGLTLIALSDILFYRGTRLPEPKYSERLVTAGLWPLMLLSPNGRKRLKQAWKGISQ